MAFSTQEIRDGFNQMIEAATSAEDHDAVARLEIAREYFTNPSFKAALQAEVWQINQGRA